MISILIKSRYLRAYWIDIHSIGFNCTFAEIHAELNENFINISAENITGITITVPPQVDKLNGIIRINGKCFDVKGKDDIIFHKNKSGFEVAFSYNKGLLFKGTCAIDPFVNPVRIINFLGGKYSDVLDNFQTPSTSDFCGSTYIKYPIKKVSAYIKYDFTKDLFYIVSFVIYTCISIAINIFFHKGVSIICLPFSFLNNKQTPPII